MRPTTKALIEHYVGALDLSGDVLEIGGHKLANSAIELFPEPRFRFHDLNIKKSDIPNTIIGDITGCRDVIADESFDVVVSSDVFEHISRPWLAADEITRILRPGGVAVTHTLWSWRNHPCPIDYWRFSAECLEFLFSDLTCLEKGYDLSERRLDQPGFWPSGNDSVPVDMLGGWREHWSVYCVARKGDDPGMAKFCDTDHRLAPELRRTTQGTVTNPKMLGIAPAARPGTVEARLAAIESSVAELTSATTRRSAPARLTSWTKRQVRKLS